MMTRKFSNTTRRIAVTTAAVVGFAAISLTSGASGAGAYVSPTQAEQAAELGASWFESTQTDNGALAGTLGGGERFGEWSLTALAAGDVNAADVAPSLTGPTAQEYYDDFWVTRGPGKTACAPGEPSTDCLLRPDGVPTDAERSVLSAVAGGIQPSRVSTDRDFVSRIAFWWDGEQLGYRDLLNDDIFGIIALDQVGAPQELLQTLALKVRSEQLSDGGWHWRAGVSNNPNLKSDTDMTGSAIGALCDAGAPVSDPAIQKGLELLEQRQVGPTGGFSTSASASAVNTNSTAWVLSAFNACGIDPQASPWVNGDGKNPLDFLVAMQNGTGSFKYLPSNPDGSANLLASYQAVSPLGGNEWSGDAPARDEAGDPAVKAAPVVAPGTKVPVTLIIDHGASTPQADRARMCRVEINEGDGIGILLAKAQAKSYPGSCVKGVSTAVSGGGVEVSSLNGGTGGWDIAIDGGPAAPSSGSQLGLGDIVELTYRGSDSLSPPAVVPVPQIDGKLPGDPVDPADPDPIDPIATLYPKAKVVGGPRYSRGRVRATLACPAGSGAIGCNTTVDFAVRRPGGKKFRRFAGTAVQIRSGNRRVVKVKAGPKVRSILRRTARKNRKGRARIRVTAGTRAADGAVAYSLGTKTIRGR